MAEVLREMYHSVAVLHVIYPGLSLVRYMKSSHL